MKAPGLVPFKSRWGVLAALASGCGGGLPLLHPAQPLPSGVTSLSAGFGSQWVGGRANREIDDARAVVVSGQASPTLPSAATIAAALYRPGFFPWASMRLGLGHQSEAGLAYTGHRVRLDARYAWLRGPWAVSFGAGAGLGLAHATASTGSGSSAFGSTEAIAGLDTSGTRAVALDLPLLVGWRSTADIGRVWLGVRPVYEHAYGSLSFTQASSVAQADLNANALTLNGILGLAMGLRPVYLALEFSVGGSHGRGSLSGSPGSFAEGSATITAITLTPAAALIWEMR